MELGQPLTHRTKLRYPKSWSQTNIFFNNLNLQIQKNPKLKALYIAEIRQYQKWLEAQNLELKNSADLYLNTKILKLTKSWLGKLC